MSLVRPGWHELRGTITNCGFASGDRFVVGVWPTSPIGSFADVMWATPAGERRLLASSPAAAAFVSAIYQFETVEAVPFSVDSGPRHVRVSAGDVTLDLAAGRGVAVPLWRPAWFVRWVEGPIARWVMGVRTYGTSPTGVREWYRARAYRPLVTARAEISGRDLGPLTPTFTAAGFGFSEPPRRAALVAVRPLLHDPAGRLPH